MTDWKPGQPVQQDPRDDYDLPGVLEVRRMFEVLDDVPGTFTPARWPVPYRHHDLGDPK